VKTLPSWKSGRHVDVDFGLAVGEWAIGNASTDPVPPLIDASRLKRRYHR
jgi:hypothetical protein